MNIMKTTWLTAREGIERAKANLSRTVAVDVGNTAYKFGFFNSPRLDAARAAGEPFSYPFSIDDLSLLPHQLKVIPIWLSIFLRKQEQRSRPLLWLVSSVNELRTRDLFTFLQKKRPNDIFAVLDHYDVPIKTNYTVPNQLGIDRALAALAASARFSEPTSVLIVDIGTAVKFDLIDSSGTFLGGAILPGPETELSSLFKGTDMLPELHWTPRDIRKSYPAVNTNDAIRLGVAGGIVGSLCYFYKKALPVVKQPQLPIIITGGGAVGLEPFVRKGFTEILPDASGVWMRTVRDLVLSGIELSRQSFVFR